MFLIIKYYIMIILGVGYLNISYSIENPAI